MALTTYQGIDLLTIHPQRVRRGEAWTLPADRFDAPTGAFAIAAHDAPSAAVTALEFVCATRAALVALDEFLAARRGRAVPFWCPSFRRDATVTDTPSIDGFTIRAWSPVPYAAVRAASPGRRFWCAIGPTRTAGRAWEIASVTDNGDGTESLVSAGPGSGTTWGGGLASYAGALVSLLSLARLDTDEIATEFLTTGVARVAVPIRELPAEAAAL